MRTESFGADTIDEAATKVLEVLKENANTTRNPSSRNNVFYFDGWDGLGASAVLRAIAQRLTGTTPAGKRALAELGFDQFIHIDCSMWESRRAFQRTVAEQLKLPDKVMKVFDQQDEEDDFRGVAEGSRAELQQVVWEIYQHTQKANRRLLVIFHNGSSEEIDLATCCGLPLSGYSTSKVLWTFQGRYRIKPRTEVDKAMKSAGTTDAFISVLPLNDEKQEQLWSYLLLQEAAEVAEACKVTAGSRDIITKPAQVAECFLYMMDLCCEGSQSIDYDLARHGANYWVCDRVIHHEAGDVSGGDNDDELWRAADALQQQMLLDMDHHQYLPSPHLARFIKSKPYWSSPTYGFARIPAGAIHNGDMFQHCSNKLNVLKLSRCTFNFQSPPFQCCQSLKFLWLDSCQDTGINNTDGEEDVRRCFQRLWVLDVRYTDCDQILSGQMMDLMTQLRDLNVMGTKKWDMGQLQGRLPNIRKLRVTKSTVMCSSDLENNLFSEMNKMELLDFTENCVISPMSISSPGAISNSDISPSSSLSRRGVSSNSSCLGTLIVGQCTGAGLIRISVKGCTNMKNLVLRGHFPSLRLLDISGTSVKTLDLTATIINDLNELYLLDCKKLCAILWPPKDKMKRDIDILYIDTTQSESTAQSRSREEISKRGTTAATIGTSSATSVLHAYGSRPTNKFSWYISVKDARLLRSIEAVYPPYSGGIHVEVFSPASPNTSDAGGCKDEEIKMGGRSDQQLLVSLQRQNAPAIYAADSTMNHQHLQQVTDGDGGAPGIMWMWPCPDAPNLSKQGCYMHVQDRTRANLLSQGGEETSNIIMPVFVVYSYAKILHVHDSLSITRIPSTTQLSSEWHHLEWCRIERCPRVVDSIFTLGKRISGRYAFFAFRLRTFWASQLPKACYIWKWSEASGYYRVFPFLTLLHLDLCPRMIHVLPLSTETFSGTRFIEFYDRITGIRSQCPNSLSQLKTLEITWCGDLREVFPLDTKAKDYVEKQQQQPVTLDFPSLKRIHLHELPSLQRICGVRMSAPNLETVKIRGCWSLKRLPDVGNGDKAVECDCEKEWWDRLEWDDRSQATTTRYKPIHSRYYKKTHLRSTVLR